VEFETVGKYKVLGKIGQGSMGVVYKAQDPVLKRYVAIKTVSEGLVADSEARKRFLREAQSAARLNHPNIVTVYELGEEQGRVYMAMELLEGKDLRQLIGTPALALLPEKLRIMGEICEGLAFAHSKDVIHRDLKPANIHVQPNGSVKVMDFGLARQGTSEMTAKGTSMGTPNYMSPEQVRGEPTDARSDVFSLGTVFYEVLTDHKAFDADTLHTILMKVAQSEPTPPRQWAPDLPQILVRMLERAVAKDPTRRFRNAGEMRSALGIAGEVLAGHLDEREGLALIEPSDTEATIVLEEPAAGGTPPDRGVRPTEVTRPPDWSRRGSLARGRTVPGGPAPSKTAPRGPSVGPSDARPAPPVAAPAASRWPVYVGAGSLVVLLVALMAWWRLARTPASSPTPGRDIAKEQMGALTDALVTSQVELAQESLKDKDYERAVTLAEKALRLDPQNAEAGIVAQRARALLKDVDAAATAARTAMQSGDTEGASRELSKVLAINPNHPVASELATQLNRHFRGQAEEARRTMSGSRAAADRAKADGQAAFAQAVAAAREAERLFGKGEFAVATRKFLESRDDFDRALRAAEAQQAAAARIPPPTTLASVTVAPPPLPIAPTPPPTVTTAATAPPPAASIPVATNEEPAIRRVVDDYARAIQSKDLALFRTVKPNLSAEEEKRLRTIFRDYKSYKVSITVKSIQIEGAQARVRVSRQDTIDGNPFMLQQQLTLGKGPEGWTIREIGQ